ncbi:hypothetical protein AK812_SmicGene25812 [Symbiodinium microadriaticum]|uniref:C2H2-type domain-containing protein n=1 Tax=Symbiodinium microadriaticum TaxID=2951 RepID=A0A1Q9DB20_SYMMI|nr:hypothetical protein AK812_SmicGene25812 [Symbiodinium microadriaticum]
MRGWGNENVERLEEALADADGQVFLVTVAGCPSCKGPCSCRLCNAAPRSGLVDYYGVCSECGKCGGHSSHCPFCLQVFPSLCALDSHVRFLHREREGAEWQTSRLEGYIRQRHLPGARRAANPEPGTFTDARTGGLPHTRMDGGGKYLGLGRFQGGAITYHSLSTWLPKVMADYVKVIVTERDLRRWLPTDDKAPHVLFFSDKKTTPPILKTLSIEFRERAAVGVVLLGSEELAKKLGVTKRPALVYIQDEETLTGEHFDKEFKKDQLARFLSRCVGRHRSQALASFRELTSSRLAGGDCAPGDSNFCLLLFSGHGDSQAMASLRTLAPRLRNDHVKVFFVKDAEFRSAFGSVPPGSVLLYRPKRRRFKLFEGDAGNIDDLAAWVDAAVGGAPQDGIMAPPTLRGPVTRAKENRAPPDAISSKGGKDLGAVRPQPGPRRAPLSENRPAPARPAAFGGAAKTSPRTVAEAETREREAEEQLTSQSAMMLSE